MAPAAPKTTSPWRIDRRGVIAIVVAVVLVLVAGGSWFVNTVVPGLGGDDNPLGSGQFYVNPDSSAARAAVDPSQNDADSAALSGLATTPQAIWLVPEEHPTSSITDYVQGVVAAAAGSDTVPVFVVYGIPERDCGNQSAGGLTAAEYPLWVTAIADGLDGGTSAVILEPDSLALADECGNLDSRITTTQDAIGRLAESGTAVYLDGGHSNWHPASETADVLGRAGIDRVRGFATNVSNYNSTGDEAGYAEQVSALTGDSHYVIDTGRNGNGSNGEWCNPSGRSLGAAPASSDDGQRDAELWIKTPGESDGECNGGPPAGEWWNAGALALVRN